MNHFTDAESKDDGRLLIATTNTSIKILSFNFHLIIINK